MNLCIVLVCLIPCQFSFLFSFCFFDRLFRVNLIVISAFFFPCILVGFNVHGFSLELVKNCTRIVIMYF